MEELGAPLLPGSGCLLLQLGTLPTCFAACTSSKVIPLQGEHVGNRWPFTTVSVRHVGMHWVVGHAETPDAGTIWPGLKTAMARLLVLRRCSI